MRLTRMLTAAAVALLLAGPISAQIKPSAESLSGAYPGKSYSPYAERSFPSRVYWGDTHLHTSNSFDAGFLNWRVDPEAAFRFGRGEEVTANNGMQVKLVRPLDWLVVSDHSEYLGLTPALRAGNPLLLKTEAGKRWLQ